MWNKLKFKKNLEAQTLNLSDAFRLASVLLPKIDLEKIKPQDDAIDFVAEVVDKLSPEEYLHCVSLLTNIDIDTIKKHASIEILTVFIEGMKLNRVVSLLGFCKSIGL